ncbi:MAG: hypothetical protein SGI92_04415 [Bryobacteraceae bacterium]|nr:hypothetical protein [Bryobacteraceae bacterium]
MIWPGAAFTSGAGVLSMATQDPPSKVGRGYAEAVALDARSCQNSETTFPAAMLVV